MNEAVAKKDYRELTNIALEDANRYIQRYYSNKKDMQSEDSGDICIMMAMRRSIGALMKELDRVTSWISVDDWLPEREEWLGTKGEEHYLRRMEIAVMSDTLEYFFVFYDGHKWFDKFGRTYGNVIAWKIHEPFNPQN